MAQTVYLNGAFVHRTEAVVSVFDGGWLHGAGLFETMRAENGRVFRLEAHLQRLQRSAKKLLQPIEREDLPSATDFAELLERNQLAAARVRMTVSAGSMLQSHTADPPPLTVCVTAIPLEPYPTMLYKRGAAVVICNFRQSRTDPTAGHKTTAHLARLLGLREASRAGCLEALWFTDRGELAEGSISNIFIARDDVLKTPPVDTPVLPGIARGIVLQIARVAGLETQEVRLTIDDLLDASEIFLTNAIMQVMPVIRVEKRDVSDGSVGPLAKRLLDEYRNLVRKECRSE